MPPFEKHIFVCTNNREDQDPRGSCAAKNSQAILDYFKAEVKTQGLQGRMRANASGCLDHCSFGPAVVVYPEAVWYRVPTLEDAKEIVESHLKHGRVVERLLIK